MGYILVNKNKINFIKSKKFISNNIIKVHGKFKN